MIEFIKKLYKMFTAIFKKQYRKLSLDKLTERKY